jgi:hypothetical protein
MFNAILPVVRPVAIAGARVAGGIAIEMTKTAAGVVVGIALAVGLVRGLNKIETTYQTVKTRRQARQIAKSVAQEIANRNLLASNGFLHRDQVAPQLHAEIQRMIDNGRLVLVADPISDELAA